jgi:hypothetical protein
MTLKIKLILAAIIVLVTVVTVISIFVYINSLNNKITDLNVTVAEQQNEIQALNCQIDSLEKNVESFRETINITNDYIENIEKVRQEEMNVKQEVYETIVEDPVAKEWYDEPLPNSLLDILMKETNDLTCNN